MIWTCSVGWDLYDLHDLFHLYGTYMYDLQFQVDLVHNILIHSCRKGYRGVKRPHTIAQHVFRARSVLSTWSVYLTYVMGSVRFVDLTTRSPRWDLCDRHDLHMFRRLGSVWSARFVWCLPERICVIYSSRYILCTTYISIAAEKDIEVWNVYIL